MTRPIQLIRPVRPVPYEQGRQMQLDLVAARQAGTGPDSLILLQHAPVITLGRGAGAEQMLFPPAALAEAGVELHRSERGGLATYHGPGQWVMYPIVHLTDWGLGVKQYVNHLEEVMIRTAADFGVEARRVEGRPGIFSATGKLGAIGVRVAQRVSFHGLSFNVAPDLSHFRFIVPCGLTDVSPTSLAAQLGQAPDLAAVGQALLGHFARVFDAAYV